MRKSEEVDVYQMSRIESEELSMMDIEWYGVDRKGKIAVFCSAGIANVPEFVCADKERQERLIALFEKLPILSGVSFCFACAEKNLLPFQVAETFSGKGFFYYDSDNHSKSHKNVGVYQKHYTISSKPTNPLFYAELPVSIQLHECSQIFPNRFAGKCCNYLSIKIALKIEIVGKCNLH